MTVRHSLLGSLLASIALMVPAAGQAQRYYDVEVYRAPPVVYEPAPPAETRIERYWDSDRGAFVERRVIEERPAAHWVPAQRLIQPDGSVYFEGGHWEYDR